MNITNILLHFISDELLLGFHKEELTAETDLLLSGLVDSLGIMRLMLFIEEELELRVPPEDVTIEHFRTVGTIANYLAARMATLPALEAGK